MDKKQNFTFLATLSLKYARTDLDYIVERLDDVRNRLFTLKGEKYPTKAEIVKYAHDPDAYKADALAPIQKWLDKSGMPAPLNQMFLRMFVKDSGIDADVDFLNVGRRPMPKLKPADIVINEYDKVRLTEECVQAYILDKASRTLSDEEQALFERLKAYIAKTQELDDVLQMFKVYEATTKKHGGDIDADKFIRPNKTLSGDVRAELDAWRVATEALGGKMAISGLIYDAVRDYTPMTDERIADMMILLLTYKNI